MDTEACSQFFVLDAQLDRQRPGGYSTSKAFKKGTAVTVNANTNYFSKVWLYHNSRVDRYLPPFTVWVRSPPGLTLLAT